MTRITWLDINASYTHSSLALPILQLACEGTIESDWQRISGTIKSDINELSVSLAASEPEVILATMYLFSHEHVINVLSRTAALLSGVPIILGGPEFLGDNHEFLQRHPYVTVVCRGPGETTLPRLLSHLKTPANWHEIPGLCWIDLDGTYHDNGHAGNPPPPWPPRKPPSASPFFIWDHPFIQLETVRGCPHRCAFCTSGQSKPLQWQTLDAIRRLLREARDHGVREIRILDRTFNAVEQAGIERLKLFREEFPDIRFHLEIHPGLVTEKMRMALKAAPPGQLHLEVGMQSTNQKVLNACDRKGTPEDMLEFIGFLCAADNLAVHVDLLCGLPEQGLADVYLDLQRLLPLGPDEIQLEILKMLPGTPLLSRCTEYGIRHASTPPYEVLATAKAKASDLLQAMSISRLIDQYYNPPQLQPSVRTAWQNMEDFPQRFFAYLSRETELKAASGLTRRAELLYGFLSHTAPDIADGFRFQWMRAGLAPGKLPGGIKSWHRELPEDAERVYGVRPDAPLPNQVTWHLRRQAEENWFVFSDRRLGQAPILIARRKLPLGSGQ